MSLSFRIMLRSAPARRRVSSRWSLSGRSPRLAFDSLESRCLLAGGPPHGGGGTLFDEHEAVMRLVDFSTIHAVAPNGPTANDYYLARDADQNPVGKEAAGERLRASGKRPRRSLRPRDLDRRICPDRAVRDPRPPRGEAAAPDGLAPPGRIARAGRQRLDPAALA